MEVGQVILLLLAWFTEYALAKGSVSRSNRVSVSRTGSGTTYWAAGAADLPWYAWGAIICNVGLIIVNCLKLCLMCKKRIQCYLCDEEISLKKWDDHRLSCAQKYEQELESMPKSQIAECPKCRGLLRMWTKMNLKAPFDCDKNESCKRSTGHKAIPNFGQQRFNCYECDYDICDECHLKLAQERGMA